MKKSISKVFIYLESMASTEYTKSYNCASQTVKQFRHYVDVSTETGYIRAHDKPL